MDSQPSRREFLASGIAAAASFAAKPAWADTSRGPLHGVPVALKDNINMDAEIVRRLKNAGAVLLGNTGFAALGTDTAGIVGFKPTHGRVSNHGMIGLSWTLDRTSLMCKSVEDVALVMNVIAGYDERDPASREVPVPDYTRALKMPTSKFRLGIVTDVELPRPGNLTVLRSAEACSADVKAWHYVQARRDVDLLRHEIKKTFAKVDLLITPAIGNNNVAFDVFGLPTISIHGLQITGAHWAESKVLALAYAYEQR